MYYLSVGVVWCRQDNVYIADVDSVVVYCRLLCVVAVRLAAALCVRWGALVDVWVTAAEVYAMGAVSLCIC